MASAVTGGGAVAGRWGDGPPRGGEARLFASARTDVRAFEAIFRAHVRRVTGYAARRCATPEDVADVVAQTFVRLLDVADRYDPARGAPAAFVLGIAANIVHDHHRKVARQRGLASRLAGRELLAGDDTERIVAAMDAARAVRAAAPALDGVPPGERAVLGLVAGGATPSEAAAELGISPGAARVRLSRVRRRLRRHMDEEGSR